MLQSRKNAFKASKSDHRSPALYEGDLKAHPAGMIEGPDYRLNSPYEPIIGQSFLGCLSNFVDVWELFIMDPTASVARGLQEPLASLALGRDQLEYFFKFYRPSLIRFLAGLPEKVKGVKEMTHHDLAKLWCSFGPGYPLYKHLGKSPVARTPPALAAAAPVPEVLAHAQRSIQSQQAEWAKAQTKKWDDAGDATSELKGGVPTQAQLQQDLGGDDGWQWDIAPKAEREGPRKPVRTLVSYREVEALFPQLKDRKALMLPRIRVGPKIKELSEIPFSLSDEYRAIKTDEMLRRAPNLPPDIQRTILGVYNRLQDKDAMARYFTELFEEAAVHAYRRGREKDLESLRAGAVPFEVLEATVVKRLKDSGDNNFTNLVGYRVVANPEGRRTNRINHREDDNRILHGTRELRNGPAGTPREQFRAAVAQGPFKDDAAPNNTNRAGHGAYSHMIQRDLVSEVIERETGGNSQKFWDFLGSKKGVHWWIDLFDSKDPNSFTQPENITEFMNHYMDQPR